MDRKRTRKETRVGPGAKAFLVAVVAAVPILQGCEGILDVDLPGVVEVDVLDDPELARLLVNGVIADFECAYTMYSAASSAQSDEWLHTGGAQLFREWGGRRIDENHENYARGECDDRVGFGVYTPVQVARFQAEDVYERISGFPEEEVPGDRNELLATVSAYAGYAYTLAGGNFCEMTFNGGPILQPDEVLAIAEDRFLRAIEYAEEAEAVDILNLARVGLARARRGMNDLEGASAVAQLVPEGFIRVVTRDPTPDRRVNRFYLDNNQVSNFSVAPGFRELEWKGVPDPRVELEYLGLETHGQEWWAQTKYGSTGADIPLATWKEAQLILAEAELKANRIDEAVAIMNGLHARVGLPDFDPDEDGDPMEHLIEQRARELFLEGGHRLNDMLRYDIPLFSGVDHFGREYGDTTCWPLPAMERQ